MAKLTGQLFARLALDYFDHPKIAGLSDAAIVTHLEMLVYSRRYLTDGRIPMRIAMRFASDALDELCANDPERPSVTRCADGSLLLHGYEDFQETREQVESRRRSGKKAAEAKWNPDAKRNAPRTAPRNAEPHPDRNTETETETETTTNAHRTASASFDQWWSHWHKKKSKGDAEKAFKAAIKKITLDELIAKTDAYWAHARTAGTDEQFIPYPGKWLRAEAWDDEPTTTAQPTAIPNSWKDAFNA